MAARATVKTIPEVSVRLVKEREIPGEVIVDGAHTVAEFLRNRVEDLDREHVFVLMLNRLRRLLAFSLVSIGTLDKAIAEPREIFRAAILSNAYSIVVVHNHPTGDPSPSDEDIQITRRLIDAGHILGIQVLDHVVLAGDGSYTSIRELCPGFFC